MMIIVPLNPVPSQRVSIVLALQNCQISVYQKSTGMFFDLTVGGVPIVSARICRDGGTLLDEVYSGFVGNFVFLDTQGGSDPEYTGLGSRWYLGYF